MVATIVQRCLEGAEPRDLTTSKLLASNLPIAWAEQRVPLGC